MARLVPYTGNKIGSSEKKLVPYTGTVYRDPNLGYPTEEEITQHEVTQERLQTARNIMAQKQANTEFINSLLPDRNNTKKFTDSVKKQRVRDLITTGGANNRVAEAQREYDYAKEQLKDLRFEGDYLPTHNDYIDLAALTKNAYKAEKELYKAKKQAAQLNGEVYDTNGKGTDLFTNLIDRTRLAGGYVGNAAVLGMATPTKSVTAFWNMTLGTLFEAFGIEDHIFKDMNDEATNTVNYYNERMSKYASLTGDKYVIGGTVISNVVAMLPSIVAALATAGGSEIVNLADKAAVLAANGGSAFLNTIKAYAKNPVYWDSFIRTVGTDYESAKEDGANEAEAHLFALLTSTVNAAVEIGGVQALPDELANVVGSKKRLWEFFKSALDEGKEEAIQRIISDANSYIVYGNNFMKDKDYKQYGKEVLNDAGMGFAVGLVMGGGHLTIDYALNADSEMEYREIGIELTKAQEYKTKAIVNYAAKSLDSNIREAALKLRSGKKDYIALGQLYQYTLNDITKSLYSSDDINVVNDNFDRILSDNASNFIKEIAASQYIIRLVELGVEKNYNNSLQDNGESDIMYAGSDGDVVSDEGRLHGNNGKSEGGQQDTGAYSQNGRARQENQGDFIRRTKSDSNETGYGKRLFVRHGNSVLAYTEKAADNRGGSSAVRMLNGIGIKTFYCEGDIETNKNGITLRHTEAITAPDGTVYVSSSATASPEAIAYHENVHVNDVKNTPAYSDYEGVICDNLLYNSQEYEDVCRKINDNQYGGKYDIESPDYARLFIREIAAYVNQFVMTEPEYANSTFSGMFKDWGAVCEAVQKFNTDTKADFKESASFMPETSVLQSTAEDDINSTNAVTKSLGSYDKNRQNVIKSYLSAVDSKIKGFAEKVKNGDLKFYRQYISDVSSGEAEEIHNMLGINVNGYTHNINTNGIKHILKRHGENGIHDSSMSDVNDIARMGWVIDNYDSIELLPGLSSELRDNKNTPADQVKYVKKIDGTYYVVEAVADNKYKKLWVQTAYLQKNNENVTQVLDADDIHPPKMTSETELASPFSDSIISHDNNNVNSEFRQKRENDSETSVLQSTAEDDGSGNGVFTEPKTPDIYREKTKEESLRELSTGKRKNAVQRHIEDLVKIFNERSGGNTNVVFDSNISGKGQYDGVRDIIRINPDLCRNTTDMYVQVFKHELMHRLETKKQYSDFKEYLFDKSDTFAKWVDMQAEALAKSGEINTENLSHRQKTEAVREYYYSQNHDNRRLTKEHREAFTYEMAEREMVSDFFGDVLFTGDNKRAANALRSMDAEALIYDADEHIEALQKEFLNEAARDDRTLLQKIKDVIRSIWNSITGRRQNDVLVKDLQRLEKKLQRVIDSKDIKNTATVGDGVRYSIQRDNSGNDIVVIDTDQGLFVGVDESEYRRVAKTYLNEHFRGTVLPLSDYNLVSVQNTGINKYVYSGKDVAKGVSNAKMKAATELDNLLSTAEYIKSTGDRKNHNFARYGFDYYRTRFVVDGKIFEGIIDIGVSEKGAEFYGITHIENITSRYSGNILTLLSGYKSESKVSQGDIFDNNISQNDTSVNTNISENGEKNSYGSPAESLRTDPERYTNWLKRKYNSTVDTDTVAESLKEATRLYNKFQGDKADEIISRVSEDIAESVKAELIPEAEEELNYIKGTEISLNVAQKASIEGMGMTVGEFKRFTGVKITDGGTPLDTVWQEWSESFPEEFKADANASDMPMLLTEAVEGLRSSTEEIDTEALAASIEEQIKKTLDTTGGRYEQRKLREAERAGFEKGEKNRQKALERYKEHIERQKDQKLQTEEKNKLKKEFERKRKRLEKRLTKPKMNGYIPQELTSAVANVLDVLTDDVMEMDGKMIASKYAADLEYLNQRVQMAENAEEIEKLKKRFDSKWAKASSVAEGVKELQSAFAKIKEDERYNSLYDSDVAKYVDNLIEVLGETPSHLLSVSQLKTVNSVLSAVENLIEHHDDVISAKYNKRVSELGHGFMREIKSSKNILGGKYMMQQLDPMRFLRRISNYGKNGEIIADILHEGQRNEQIYQQKAEAIFSDVMSAENFEKAAKLQSTKAEDIVDSGLREAIIEETGDSEPGKEIKIKGVGDKIMVTRAVRLALVMHSFSSDNMRHFANHVNIPAVDGKGKIKDVNGLLTDDIEKFDVDGWRAALMKDMSDYELNFLLKMQEYYWAFSGDMLNEVTLKRFGFEKARNPFYYGIVTDPAFVKKQAETVKFDVTLENAGILKERVHSKNPLIVEDAITKLNRDIKCNAKIYGYMIPLHDFNRIYNYSTLNFDSSVKSAIRDTFSGRADKDGKSTSHGEEYVDKLIKDLTGISNRNTTVFDRLKGNSAQATLMLNPAVSFKQSASYITAAVELGYKPLAKALAVVEKDGGEKSLVFARAEQELIAKYSPLLWYRMRGNINNELGDINSARGIGDSLSKTAPSLFNWIQKIDGATVGRLWYASKYYVEDNFKTLTKGSDAYYKKVAEVFERVVERTQPNYTIMNRPDILRSDNALIRAMTMYYTQRLQNVNIIIDAAGEMNARLRDMKLNNTAEARAEFKVAQKRFGSAISSQLLSAATLSLLELAARAIMNNMNPYRDDEDNEVKLSSVLAGLGSSFIDTVIGSFLGGSEVYEAFMAAFTALGGKGKFSGFSVPAVESLNDFISAIINLSKDASLIGEYHSGQTDLKELAEAYADNLLKLAEAVGQFTGLPVSNIKKMLMAGYYSVADIITHESFAQATKDNTLNRLFGKSQISTNIQKYNALIEASRNGDDKKYNELYKELLESGKSDSDISSGIKKILKEETDIKKQVKAETEKLKDTKDYKSLTSAAQENAEDNLKTKIVLEQKVSITDGKSDVYDTLYEKLRKGGRKGTDFVKLYDKLLKEGKSKNQIEDGLEIAKFAYMKSQGVNLEDYILYKATISKANYENVDTDSSGGLSESERKNALNKMKISKKAKNYFYKNK